jgi:hypothetical protein
MRCVTILKKKKSAQRFVMVRYLINVLQRRERDAKGGGNGH